MIGFLIRRESFKTSIPTLRMSFDRLPNPTKEERTVSKLQCKATRLTAKNVLGRLYLRWLWRKGNLGGPSSLTDGCRVLEIYHIER